MGAAQNPPLSATVKLSYGLPTFVGAAMAIPILVLMPKFYSDVVLMPVGSIAVAIALARAFDAIVDPSIGWLSDHTRSRWGRRRPWILAGALLTALSFWMLCNPPDDFFGGDAVPWFAVTFWAYFFFHSIYEIPYLGLGAELSTDSAERTSLFTYRSAFLVLGTIFASVLPTVLSERYGGDQRHVFATVGKLYAVLLVLLFGQLVLKVRESPKAAGHGQAPLVPGVRRALRNGPFRALLIASIVYSIPSAIPALLLPYYTAYVIAPKSPLIWIGKFLFLYLGSGFLALPLWMWVARRFGKLVCWVVCNIIGVVGSAAMFLPGRGQTGLAAIIQVFVGMQFGAFFFLGPAMVSDIIDYDEFHTGRRREAQYTAFLQMVPKFTAIPGASIPLAVLAMMGYAPNQVQTATVQMTIRVLFALVPAAFNLTALLFILRYRLTEAAHRSIREGIGAHAAGKNAVDPLTGGVVPPPHASTVDEKTSWFLDHFSTGELRRLLAGNPSRLRRDSSLCAALTAAGVTIVLGVFGWYLSAGHGQDPGAVVALAIGGFGLAAALFHLVRVRAAMRFETRPVDASIVRAHLEMRS